MDYDQIKLAQILDKFDVNEITAEKRSAADICDYYWRDEETGMSPLLLSIHSQNFKATELLLSYTSIDSLTKHEKYDTTQSNDGRFVTFVHLLIAIPHVQLLKNVFVKCCTPKERQDFFNYLNLQMKCEVHISRRSVSFNETIYVTCFEYALLKGRMDMIEEFFSFSENFISICYKTAEDIDRLALVIVLSYDLNHKMFEKIFSESDFSNSIFANPDKFLQFLSHVVRIGNFAFAKLFFVKFKRHKFFKDPKILYDFIGPAFSSADEDFAYEFLNNFIERYLGSKLPNSLINDDKEKQNILVLAASNGYFKIVHYILNSMCYNLNVSKSSLEEVFNLSLKCAANSRNVNIIKLIFSEMNNMTLCKEFWEEVIVKHTVDEIGFEKFNKEVFQEFRLAELKHQIITDKKAILHNAIKHENIVALTLILEEREILENSKLVRDNLQTACDTGSAEVVHLLLDKITAEELLEKNIQPLSDFIQQLMSKESILAQEQFLLSKINSRLQTNINKTCSDSRIILPDTVDGTLIFGSLEAAVNLNKPIQTFLKLPASIRRKLTRMLIHLKDNISEVYNTLFCHFDDKQLKLLNHIIISNEVMNEKGDIIVERTTPLHLIAERLDKDMLILMLRNNVDILAVDSNGDTVLHRLAKLSGCNKDNEIEYVKIASIILNLYLNCKIPSEAEQADERRHVIFIIFTRLIVNKQSMSVVSYAVFHKATALLEFLLEVSVDKLAKELNLSKLNFISELKYELPTMVDMTDLCENTMPMHLTNRKLFEALSIVSNNSELHRGDLNLPYTFVSDPITTNLQQVKIKTNCSFLDILSDISYNKNEFINVLHIPVVKRLASHFSRDYRFTMVFVLVIHILFITYATLLATIN